MRDIYPLVPLQTTLQPPGADRTKGCPRPQSQLQRRRHDYDPKIYPGAYFRLNESAPLITVYRTGKYIIIGSDSEKEASSTRTKFLQLLAEHSILPEPKDEWYDIQNYVCMANIDHQLDLSALAIGLGLEVTEYEPEQFPGLVYRPLSHDCVMLIFSSGKVIITGVTAVNPAEEAFGDLLDQIDPSNKK